MKAASRDCAVGVDTWRERKFLRWRSMVPLPFMLVRTSLADSHLPIALREHCKKLP